MESFSHLPVLVEQVVKNALPQDGRIFADVTFGLGGHTKAILGAYPSIERVIAIDRDSEILESSENTFSDGRITRIHGLASNLPEIAKSLGIYSVDGILADLGFSSPQIDDFQRGFSFLREGPLDMRMDRTANIPNAADIINTAREDELSNIFHEYGEERYSRRIAAAIVKRRTTKPFNTTRDLADLVEKLVPNHGMHDKHPATRVFQALRIAVNDELSELEKFLQASINLLNPGGHLVIIAFHSLEDRIVKNYFIAEQKGCVCPPKFPICRCGKKPRIEVLTRKPLTADAAETASNPRSRSAKLRAARRI